MLQTADKGHLVTEGDILWPCRYQPSQGREGAKIVDREQVAVCHTLRIGILIRQTRLALHLLAQDRIFRGSEVEQAGEVQQLEQRLELLLMSCSCPFPFGVHHILLSSTGISQRELILALRSWRRGLLLLLARGLLLLQLAVLFDSLRDLLVLRLCKGFSQFLKLLYEQLQGWHCLEDLLLLLVDLTPFLLRLPNLLAFLQPLLKGT
mmetsp:Transcript_948/g.3402  ORF Transcript_948/g.3402 Transcript_948/m.3402 type:complete len:207 (-) Transcript_948:268-888(-)